MRAPWHTALAVIMGSLAFRAAGAQRVTDRLRKPVGLLVRSHPGVLQTDPGATITASFRVENPSLDSLTVMPTLKAPAEWSIVLGDSPFSLASRESDTWLVSVRVPSRTAPGRYAVHLRAVDPWSHALMADSLVVDVRAVRGVDLMVAERPSYAVAGIPYYDAFLLSNRGNAAATFALRAVSSTGVAAEVPARLQLHANESRLIRVAVAVELPGVEARDDVLELRAVDVADSTVRATASSRVTIVQRAGSGDEFHTVAATLRLRAAGAAAGVSPYELMGGGQLRDGGKEQLEFVARGRPAPGSPFGDREEYRIGIRGQHFNTQIGDALYMASPLTSAGQRGFGGGLTLGDSSLGIGGYAQRFRFQLDGGSEQGAFLHLGSDGLPGAPHIGVNGVNRQDGQYPGQVLSAAGGLHPVGDMVVDVEYATSNAVTAGRGAARSARVGAGEAVHVDVGHLDADSSYAGPSRGSRYDFASLNTTTWNDLQLRGSYASTRTTAPALLGVENTSFVHTGVAELSYLGRYSVGFTSFERAAGSQSMTGETQRGLTARADQSFRALRFWGTAEAGRTSAIIDSIAHGYGIFSAGTSAQLGRSMLALFGETSHGATVMRGGDRTRTLGFDAQLQITDATQFAVSGSDTRSYLPDGGYTYVDARLTQGVPNGGSVSLRVRLGGHDIHEAAIGQRLAYLEYSTPLQLPIGPSHAPGRVQGRVVDQQTGRGVSGALVRLGPQAAITDDDGRVAFAGLPAGAYRLTLAQPLTSGSSVFNGNPDVRVDSASHAPARFSVAIEPAGRISGAVRRSVLARTGIGSVPDSLADGGPVQGVSIALAGARDTLYRTTDVSGTYVFTDVPSGSWTLIVMGEIPEQTQWEQEMIPIVLRAGQQPVVDFRLIPKRRRVKIVSGDGIDERGGGDK
jgi:hypothetical protein